MTQKDVDLTSCDREPIHIPGAIQPHGAMLIVDALTGAVAYGAGDVGRRLGRQDWLGSDVRALLGLETLPAPRPGLKSHLRRVRPPGSTDAYDAGFHLRDGWLIVELEPAASDDSSAELLPHLETAAASFEKALDLKRLCEVAATEFRRLTGYDRVMVYRLLDDESGVVLGEDVAPGQHSFLNHHFPATDIPKQARALYVRNLVRVIPDVSYTPAPLEPAWPGPDPLDMSDCDLRSISPVHIQYLKNMGVAASASVSIVQDGKLWGLVACHSATPRFIAADRRIACRALAAGLARQIKAREETDAYRQRVRLRTYEDRIIELLLREGLLDEAVSHHLDDLLAMLDGDGVAVLRGNEVVRSGRTPSEAEIRKLAAWLGKTPAQPVFSTHVLAEDYALAPDEQALAGGLLAITLSAADPWLVMWFRAEAVQVVEWAGNPHKTGSERPDGLLNPRSSFAAWSETVRGRSRRWTIPEIESAKRLRSAVLNVSQTRQILDLNRRLVSTIDQKESLLKQNEFLLGEISHRVQNSLQLVSSFLQLQARELDEPTLRASFEEARRRIAAVSLVHKRLYNTDQFENVDLSLYVEELLDELVSSLGQDWQAHLSRDLQSVVMPNERAVSLGLVLTELVININKYAYAGAAGPIRVTLTGTRNTLRLTIGDEGKGRSSGRKGFGTRMLNALVERLDGTIEYQDAHPGTRAIVSAPIKPN